jgi:hypothetical protein
MQNLIADGLVAFQLRCFHPTVLKMRRGKQIAQGAHAAMAFFTPRLPRVTMVLAR